MYHQELRFDHRVLSVDCDVSNKIRVVHSKHLTETRKNVSCVFRVHITSANTKILVFGPCIFFSVRLLVFSEQTAIILLCSF